MRHYRAVPLNIDFEIDFNAEISYPSKMDASHTQQIPKQNILANISNFKPNDLESEQNPIENQLIDSLGSEFEDDLNIKIYKHAYKPNKFERAVDFINKWTGIKTKWADLSTSMRVLTVSKLLILAAIIVGLIYFGIVALLGVGGVSVSGMGAVALAKSLGFSGTKTLAISSLKIAFKKEALSMLTYVGIGFGAFGSFSLGTAIYDCAKNKEDKEIEPQEVEPSREKSQKDESNHKDSNVSNVSNLDPSNTSKFNAFEYFKNKRKASAKKIEEFKKEIGFYDSNNSWDKKPHKSNENSLGSKS